MDKIKGQTSWNKGLTKETDTRVRSQSEKMKGRVPWNKGKKGYHSHTPESKLKLSKAAKGKKLTSEHKQKISKALKGRKKSELHCSNISLSLTGRKLSISHRLNVAKGLRNSKKFHDAMLEQVNKQKEKTRVKLREEYDISEGVKFIPVSLEEHIFARRVLIENKPGDGLISGNWERDIPEFVKKRRGVIRFVNV